MGGLARRRIDRVGLAVAIERALKVALVELQRALRDELRRLVLARRIEGRLRERASAQRDQDRDRFHNAIGLGGVGRFRRRLM